LKTNNSPNDAVERRRITRFIDFLAVGGVRPSKLLGGNFGKRTSKDGFELTVG